MSWRCASYGVWAGLGIVTVCLVVAQLRGRLPSLREALRGVTARPAGRGVVLLVWMWLGWHVFAR
jgi:hypothetical protein